MARRLTIAAQAEAFECAPSAISAVETGRNQPDINYAKKFASWVSLDVQQEQELIKSVRLSQLRTNNMTKEALRLYRKINQFSPSEIRELKARSIDGFSS